MFYDKKQAAVVRMVGGRGGMLRAELLQQQRRLRVVGFWIITRCLAAIGVKVELERRVDCRVWLLLLLLLLLLMVTLMMVCWRC